MCINTDNRFYITMHLGYPFEYVLNNTTGFLGISKYWGVYYIFTLKRGDDYAV